MKRFVSFKTEKENQRREGEKKMKYLFVDYFLTINLFTNTITIDKYLSIKYSLNWL